MSGQRIPLRPLSRVIEARKKGENPDYIERENLRQRHEAERDKLRLRAEGRILVVALCFLLGFGAVGVRMGALAASEPQEPGVTSVASAIQTARADIVDRQGRILATNLLTNALYAHPHEMVDPLAAAEGLVEIFPEMDYDRLVAQLTSERRFLWLRRSISPEQEQAVHDLGEPGLLFGPREIRLYPNGAIAAHILGGAGFGQEAVNAAEIVGVAGLEAQFDAELRDPARAHTPLRLSMDLAIQSATEEVLASGMGLMNARGASAVLMDAHTGEVISLASLPDFDPNARPRQLTSGNDPSQSPLFNRAVQGVYELGSVFKIFTMAQALELDMVTPETSIDTTSPLRIAGFNIRDFHNYGPRQTATEVIVHSSNIGTARIADEIGPDRQRLFLQDLGLLEATPIEIVEASTGRPMIPARWERLSTMTVSYGHGLSISPLHLAAGFAAMVNGGTRVAPTLITQRGAPQTAARIISEDTSAQIRAMMRAVVDGGTASLAEVEGYEMGGKTGTADKPNPSGGYYEDRVIATFAGAFPMSDPQYVIVVTLDEPEIVALGETRRTAGWTSAPVAAEILRRVGPLLNLQPRGAAEIAQSGVSRLSSRIE
ncbi:penicillin-binding protein 2 [Rhodobacterales bacterium LSUCC0387]|nr:penicillin-binding protein 2 [Rhodobacterales bacterium LSUCC0387]